MQDREKIEENIKNYIVETVQKHWKNTGQALLLSALGGPLRKAIPESKTVIAQGPKKYLSSCPVVQLVPYPGVEEKIGLVPIGIPLPEDRKNLFSSKLEQPAATSNAVYNDHFWKAFIRPVKIKRIICVENTGDFTVVDDNETPPVGKIYEITKDDIATFPEGTPALEKIPSTHQKINAWLIRNSLDGRIFEKTKIAALARSSEGKLAMLKAIFHDISEEDQARITIPLDILIKLISRH